MIRVLQCVNNMDRAGLETMIMNYYRHIDRSQIQFDFLMHRPDRSDYDDEIEAMGGKIFRAPRLYPRNYPAYFRYTKRFFSEHPEYRIIHSHIDAMSYLPLLAAKFAGVPIRVAHSHSTSIDRDMKYLLKQGFRFLLPFVATHYFSCGEKAGKFLFRGKPFQVIPNAIDASSFLYDLEMRTEKRVELNLEGKFVVGHVGRFCYPKNHEFLVDIFENVYQKNRHAVLMLVGTGKKETRIREYVREKNLSDAVLFMGNRSDVKELYQAMDVFVLPSLFEGIPVVGIEAQFSGLPCVFSDTIAKEVSFSPKNSFLSLKLPAEAWCEHIIKVYEENKREIPVDSDWYNIRYASKLLVEFYREFRD